MNKIILIFWKHEWNRRNKITETDAGRNKTSYLFYAMESVFKSINTEKSLNPGSFMRVFYQTFKKWRILTFKGIAKERILQTNLIKAV